VHLYLYPNERVRFQLVPIEIRSSRYNRKI
jgi:hypothetical protein